MIVPNGPIVSAKGGTGEKVRTMDTKIKVLIAALLFLVACSSDSGDSSGDAGMAELTMGVTETGTIETMGEVDTYSLQVAETNRYLTITCDEKSSGSGVDLMVTVFEEDEDGNRTRLFGKHKPLDATPPADIDMTLYIDEPKNLIITVRDVMDDDASSTVAYHLTCDYAGSGEGNHDFANAVSLSIGASSILDAIEEVGEVDCFTFSPDSTGVYSVEVAFTSNYSATDVQLATALYDADGNRIQTITEPDTVMLALLDPADGPFYVTVHDSDDSDSDTSAVYGVSVVSVNAGETMANDAFTSATLLTQAGGEFEAEGALEYSSASPSIGDGEDMDYYAFELTDPAPDTYQAVDIVISGDSSANASLIFRVEVYDENYAVLMSRDVTCTGDDYQNRFRAESGTHYVSIIPLNPNKLDSGAEYRITLTPGDLDDDENDTIADAITLTSGDPEEGGIGYMADVDWYSLAVDINSPQIVSVSLVGDSCIVEYQLSIWRDGVLIDQFSDIDGTDGETQLKTAFYVPGDGGSATYYFKVGDAQNDEGTNASYTITATAEDIPASVDLIEGETPRYYSEADEQEAEVGDDYTELELEINSVDQPIYLANTAWLDFKASTLPDGVATSLEADGTTLITFPWIAGYIDYQGDRDMFQIDLDKLTEAGTETEWYYDIEIRMVVLSPGSDVEYVWKFYRDSNTNGIVMDDPTARDGYKACAGDQTPETTEVMDLTVPDETKDETFWVGSDWGDGEKFFLGISDFNYEIIPSTGEENPDNDNDWGYDRPYYFKLQLTYHPDIAEPEE